MPVRTVINIVELQWLHENIEPMKICSRQGLFEPMRVDNSARSGGIIGISLILYNMKVYCVFSLESPQ